MLANKIKPWALFGILGLILALTIYIALFFKIQGNYFCKFYTYLDDGKHYVTLKNGEMWLTSEYSTGKAKIKIGTYKKTSLNSYEISETRSNVVFQVKTGILGLYLSPDCKARIGLTSGILGCDFFRVW